MNADLKKGEETSGRNFQPRINTVARKQRGRDLTANGNSNLALIFNRGWDEGKSKKKLGKFLDHVTPRIGESWSGF